MMKRQFIGDALMIEALSIIARVGKLVGLLGVHLQSTETSVAAVTAACCVGWILYARSASFLLFSQVPSGRLETVLSRPFPIVSPSILLQPTGASTKTTDAATEKCRTLIKNLKVPTWSPVTRRRLSSSMEHWREHT